MRYLPPISFLVIFGLPACGADGAADVLGEYRAAREALPDSARVVVCENVELKRPGGSLLLKSGQLAFLPPLSGRTWAAVFEGQGEFHFAAPAKLERAQTRRFYKKEEVQEQFTEAVLLFSDGSEAEILKSGKAGGGATDAHKGTLKWAREVFREKLHLNAEAAVLRYLLRGEGAYFLALLKTKQVGTLLYEFAPFDQEEISLLRLRSDDFDAWNSFPLSDFGAQALLAPVAKESVDTKAIRIDAALDGAARLSAQSEVEFEGRNDRERLIHLGLSPHLRVTEVKDQAGRALGFIQESEKRDGAFWVLAPAPLQSGQNYKWQISYAGKDVVTKAGDGNFYVGARSSWFPRPRVPGEVFTDRARFHMKFRVPKNFSLVATGKELSRKIEGKQEVSEWDSEQPVTVAGFNYGKFTVKTMEANGFKVSVHANSSLGDELAQLKLLLEANPSAAGSLGITPGGLTTTGMSDRAAVEALNCLTFYTRLFGPVAEKYLRITQQPAGNFGQSWPGLLFMPYTSFLDSTTRNQLKLDQGGMRKFLAEVGPHEVAHQWWGHAVVWRDYHDQWLSEGFAEYSAGLYLQSTKGTKPFLQFLRNQKEEITTRADARLSPNEAGPLWMGQRLSAEDSPYGSQLIYAKGAYVLHMLRMLQHDFKTHSDGGFLEMMRSFVREFADRPASTADFEKHVSKHFGRDMSYFFDQWVRGTDLPKVRGQYSVVPKGGQFEFTIEPRIEDVPEGFVVEMPVALSFKEGATAVGWFHLTAPGATVRAMLSSAPESVTFAPTLDVLADIDIRKK